MFDIGIIGAGAAGMTAAVYALRAKKSVILFEEKAEGGQILATTRIENYPAVLGITGAEFAKNLKEQVRRFGGEFEFSRVEGVVKTESGFVLETEDGEFRTGAVIIANGSKERELGLPEEKEFVGRGVSYCATCDGEFFRRKTVGVVGGGNTALYCALYLAKLARKVFLIHRRGEFRAEKHLVERAAETENVEFLTGAEVVRLKGDGRLERVVVRDRETGEGREVEMEGLFVMIGREARNEKFRGLVRLDRDGYIIAGEDCCTETEGVFVAGDTRAKALHQLVTATADGAVAGSVAVDFLNAKNNPCRIDRGLGG